MPRPSSGFIDLHTHTTASDGSYAPAELLQAASARELDVLAVTDHDTFDGYEAMVSGANDTLSQGFPQIVRGIELNSTLELDGGSRSVHVLGYWPGNEPTATFVEWIRSQQDERRDRNQRLIAALQSRGVDIDLKEVEAIGRSLTGRPHFARVLVRKGYAKNGDDAFRRYLGETAPTYVERQSPTAVEVVGKIREGGGAPVIAHPIRLNLPDRDSEWRILSGLKKAGLFGLEVQHSEHSAELQDHYLRLAEELHLLPTGGSDFHGAIKPDIQLGSGRDGNVRVPTVVWEEFRDAFAATQVT
jgi:predicted metal-dependent phosphoesterase TrpH